MSGFDYVKEELESQKQLQALTLVKLLYAVDDVKDLESSSAGTLLHPCSNVELLRYLFAAAGPECAKLLAMVNEPAKSENISFNTGPTGSAKKMARELEALAKAIPLGGKPESEQERLDRVVGIVQSLQASRSEHKAKPITVGDKIAEMHARIAANTPPQSTRRKVYIASSWKNVHAVQMLTSHLRAMGLEVLSCVENANEKPSSDAAGYREWVASERGAKAFTYDTNSAMEADLLIYVGPSGCDAWAEVGAAWAKHVPVFALDAKGEQIGLMRRMATWFDDYVALQDAVAKHFGVKGGEYRVQILSDAP